MDALLTVLDVALLASTIRLVTPILLAALGGLLSERVGIFNVALEGLMLIGAFLAVAGAHWTGNPFVGLALNLLALGLTTYLIRPVFGVQGSFYDPNLHGLPDIHIAFVEDIPVLG